MANEPMPDPREEAARIERELGNCCGDVINIYSDELEAKLRSLMARTLRAAALEMSHPVDEWQLLRLAAEIEQGGKRDGAKSEI